MMLLFSAETLSYAVEQVSSEIDKSLTSQKYENEKDRYGVNCLVVFE